MAVAGRPPEALAEPRRSRERPGAEPANTRGKAAKTIRCPRFFPRSVTGTCEFYPQRPLRPAGMQSPASTAPPHARRLPQRTNTTMKGDSSCSSALDRCLAERGRPRIRPSHGRNQRRWRHPAATAVPGARRPDRRLRRHIGVGSGNGKAAFLNNDYTKFVAGTTNKNVHWAGSDSKLSKTNETNPYLSAHGSAWGPLIQVPSVATSVALPFNKSGSNAVNFADVNTLCGVFSGRLTD